MVWFAREARDKKTNKKTKGCCGTSFVDTDGCTLKNLKLSKIMERKKIKKSTGVHYQNTPNTFSDVS
jgi:hypothetical protein